MVNALQNVVCLQLWFAHAQCIVLISPLLGAAVGTQNNNSNQHKHYGYNAASYNFLLTPWSILGIICDYKLCWNIDHMMGLDQFRLLDNPTTRIKIENKKHQHQPRNVTTYTSRHKPILISSSYRSRETYKHQQLKGSLEEGLQDCYLQKRTILSLEGLARLLA